MKNNLVANYFKGIGLTAVIIVAIYCFSPVNTLGQTGECNAQCQHDLANAAAGTVRFLDESHALAEGFVSTEACIAIPNLGAMGIHYANFGRLMDLDVNAAEPEFLLYEPGRHGKSLLVGVEYFAPVIVNGQPWFGDANTPPPPPFNAAPVLFGRNFDGPSPGNFPGQPWHYDLHVWVWRHNPLGLFAPFNPMVQCPSN